jgi:cytochrome c556
MTDTATPDDSAILAQLVQWHESAEQATADSRELCERDRDYYDHKQWTEAEEATLKKRKQPIVTSNRIKPKVDFLLGMERQRRADPKAYPRNPGDEGAAFAASDSLKFVVQQNKWDRKRSECFENLLIEGACGADVSVYKDKKGEYCIELAQIPWDRMWGDPHSRKKDFSDGKYRGQFLWMDVEEAAERWPGKDEALDATVASESAAQGQTFDDVPRLRWADPKRKRVRIAECWSKEGGKVYYTAYTKAGILERIESPYKDENGDPEDGFIFGSAFVDRDGNRYGVVRGWISLQDEINKRRSKALHLLSVRQTIGEKGAVDDVARAKAELAKPDGHVEITPGMKFEIAQTGDMAAAQFDLLNEAKNEIDAVGVNAALSGNEGRVMSGRALQARSEQGMAELGPVFDAFEQFQHDVYRKIWNRIKQFWTEEKWVRVTEDDNNVKFVGINQPLTLGEKLMDEAKKSGQPIPPEIQQQMAQDPRMSQVVGVKNNVGELDIDIVIDDTPASASIQAEEFEALMKIAPAMAQSGKPFDPEILIEASSLRGKDKILKKMRGEGENGPATIPPEVQQQMQQMQEQMQMMDQALQEAQGQLQEAQSGVQAKLKQSEMDAEIKAHQAEIDAAAKRQQADDDMQFAREKAELDARLAIEKARLEQETKLQIAQMNIESDETIAAMRQMAQPVPESAPEESDEVKTITVTGPSGATYTGTIDHGQISINGPSGANYNGTIR